MARLIFLTWGPEGLSEKLSRALQAPVIATFGNSHLVPGEEESSLFSTQIIVGLLTKFSLVQDFVEPLWWRPSGPARKCLAHRTTAPQRAYSVKTHFTHGEHRHGEGVTQHHAEDGFNLLHFRCLRCQRPKVRWGSKLHGNSTSYRWRRLGRESPG